MKAGLYEELKILRRCVGRGINENHREGDEITEQDVKGKGEKINMLYGRWRGLADAIEIMEARGGK